MPGAKALETAADWAAEHPRFCTEYEEIGVDLYQRGYRGFTGLGMLALVRAAPRRYRIHVSNNHSPYFVRYFNQKHPECYGLLMEGRLQE